MIAMGSQHACASSKLWVTRRTVLPSSSTIFLRRKLRNSAAAPGSNPLVGSSSNKTVGLVSSARANCGAENPERAKFCIACAAAFSRPCAQCGTVNPPHAVLRRMCHAPHRASSKCKVPGAKSRLRTPNRTRRTNCCRTPPTNCDVL